MRELLKYLECAMVCSTHGVRGNVRLENRCNSPEELSSLKRMYTRIGDSYKEFKVEHASVQKNMVLAKLSGVDTVEAAAAMRGTVLYAAREDMPLEDGEHFIADMLGLPVIDNETGRVIGELVDVISPGAQQIYVVKGDQGRFMIPCVPEFIKEVSLGEGDRAEGIYVSLIEGMDEPV